MRKYAQRILKGLQYLHKNHVAHKSLNVSNLILDNELSVKLTNFGVFKQLAGNSSFYLHNEYIILIYLNRSKRRRCFKEPC